MAEDEVIPEAPAEIPAEAPEESPEAPVEKEGTTPEEVAQVLKGSGMKLPAAPKVEEEKPADEPAEEEDAEPKEPAEEEVTPPAKTPEAPAEVTPEAKVFSIEVQDANGVTFKITAGDSLEDALKDFEPKNNGQILQVLRDVEKMEADKARYDADQITEAETAAKSERIAKIQEGWTDEIKELQAQKRIPENGKDSDNTRVAEVYKFMSEENGKRIAANKPTIGSFEDALDKLENKEAREAKVEADKTDREIARKNGGLVGGSSAPASNAPAAYKAGTARNSADAIRKLGLLK